MRRMKMGTAQQPIPQKIIVYGHSKANFPNPKAMIDFIEGRIVEQRYRYRYTKHNPADIIILSLGGFAFGHFEIRDKVVPDDRDRREFPPVKCTYIVGSRASYLQPVKMMPLGIRVHSFGTNISVAQFEQIKKQAGHIEEFP